ncbi:MULTISPECIES: copper resistance protein B [unclassified Sphingomonas]|uniref:copper resistance protein B n=1 Tax=unclassified Sphingomonas TaxID=196159 RepID=UPI00226A565C|nr:MULTISPECIES: copper resistance protein B [unclassified Sphingomonas]
MRWPLGLVALLPGMAAAQAMPGMTMPMPVRPSAPVRPIVKHPAHHPPMHADRHPAVPAHAEPLKAEAKPDAMSAMDMTAMPGMTMPPAAQALAGTALPAGDAPAPAAPRDHYADRDWPVAAMAAARRRMMAEQGGQVFYQLLFNLAELQVRDGRVGYRWDGEAWIGGDRDGLVLKSEGDGGRHGVDAAELQALYSRAIGPYFDLQAGLRHDVAPAPRSYATLGIEGLAPYMVETEAALFLSDRGDLLGRIEGWYDERLNQRLVLQPRVELNLAAQDVARSRIGAGLSNAELGLRLRYEIAREFAPYVGLSWDRRLGATARYARADGEDPSQASLVAGVRFWF